MQAPNRLTKHEQCVDHVEAPALARLVKHRPAAGLARVDVGAAAQQERCDLQSTERTALTHETCWRCGVSVCWHCARPEILPSLHVPIATATQPRLTLEHVCC